MAPSSTAPRPQRRAPLARARDHILLSGAGFNPMYFTPPYTRLSVPQLSQARKTTGSLRAVAPAANQGSQPRLIPSVRDKTSGTSKVRGQDIRYSWTRTCAEGPLLNPGAVPAGDGSEEVGSLRIHRYNNGLQVWFLDYVKGATHRQLQWIAAHHGAHHPTLPTHFLQLHDQKMPTWVTRNTLTTYASRRKRGDREVHTPETEEDVGDDQDGQFEGSASRGQTSVRVRL